MKDKLLADLKVAMKEKNVLYKNTIQAIRTEVLQVEKDKQIELDNDGITDIIVKLVRQRKSNLEEYLKTDRQDIISNLKEEIKILQSYLPEPLTMIEVLHIIAKAIKLSGGTSVKDIKAVITIVEPQVRGRADMKEVSRLIREGLK